MAVSEAHRKGNRKWDSENMTTLGCKLRKDQALKFKKYAEDNGTTANALLKDYVLEKIGEKEVNKNIPCFVFNLDKRIKVTNEQILIPIGIQNKTDIPVFHLQLCKYDDGKYIKVSDTQPEHDIYDYLSKDNASKDETVYFVITCNEEVNGCDLRFCIKFNTSNGSCYKQEFRIQYSSVLYENGSKGVFTRNCFYGLPEPISD